MNHHPSSEENTKTPETHTKKWYHTSWKAISSLHPAWYICIGLTLLLASTIIHYEYREYRVNSFGKFSNYGWYDRRMNHMNDSFNDMDNPWWMFDREMQSMEQTHRTMQNRMETMMQEMPVRNSNGQYTGFRSVNNQSLNYSFSSNDGKVNGTVTTTGTGWFGEIQKSIESLGYSVTGNSDTLNINGSAERLPELMSLLGK